MQDEGLALWNAGAGWCDKFKSPEINHKITRIFRSCFSGSYRKKNKGAKLLRVFIFF
jgi:hypothetical protein